MAGPERGNRLRTLFTASAVVGLAAWLFAGAGQRQGGGQAVASAGADAPPSAPALGEGFEPSDVRTRSIAIAMVIGVAAIGLSIGGLVLLLQVLHARDAAGPALTPQQTAVITPPGPPLQSAPLVDIATLRDREAATLSAYGWLGPDHAAAHIPIGRAMALVVGRPLDPPAPAGAPQAGTTP